MVGEADVSGRGKMENFLALLPPIGGNGKGARAGRSRRAKTTERASGLRSTSANGRWESADRILGGCVIGLILLIFPSYIPIRPMCKSWAPYAHSVLPVCPERALPTASNSEQIDPFRKADGPEGPPVPVPFDRVPHVLIPPCFFNVENHAFEQPVKGGRFRPFIGAQRRPFTCCVA